MIKYNYLNILLIFAETNLQSCIDNGIEYEIGEVFHKYADQCVKCLCVKNDFISCNRNTNCRLIDCEAQSNSNSDCCYKHKCHGIYIYN